MGQTSEEGRGGEEIRLWSGEMARKPGESKVRGTADSPVRPVREARAVETLVLRRVIPGRWWILPGDRVEIWTDR